MSFQAFLVSDFGAIELPDHEQAQRNLDFTNPHLLIKSNQRLTDSNGKSDKSRSAEG